VGDSFLEIGHTWEDGYALECLWAQATSCVSTSGDERRYKPRKHATHQRFAMSEKVMSAITAALCRQFNHMRYAPLTCPYHNCSRLNSGEKQGSGFVLPKVQPGWRSFGPCEFRFSRCEEDGFIDRCQATSIAILKVLARIVFSLYCPRYRPHVHKEQRTQQQLVILSHLAWGGLSRCCLQGRHVTPSLLCCRLELFLPLLSANAGAIEVARRTAPALAFSSGQCSSTFSNRRHHQHS